MKMHISQEDLENLTEAQKCRLTELWKPEKYDLAVAVICKDADNEEYDKFEFIIGNILVDNYAHIYLFDIKAPEINSQLGNENVCDELIEEKSDDCIDENIEEQEQSEEDFDLELTYVRPTCVNKGECIPLLNIGQMIEILKRKNFGVGDFYMTVGTAEIGCELGKNAANFNMYSSDYDNNELCDCLWELVKTIL